MDDDPRRPRLHHRLGRVARLGLAGARASASWAAGSLLAGLGGDERAGRLRGAAAARGTRTLGELKGLAMKVGQYVSFALPDLPPELAEALSTLQASAPPRPFAEIAAVAEASLGRPLAEAFARFDRAPVAAASIGQVHRAWLHDGTAVAVKVQYPDVADAVRADLANAAALAGTLRLLLPGLDAGAVAEEVRARILEELDYRAEAAWQVRFGARFARHPFIAVPAPVLSLCADRVLTTAWAAGLDFAGARQAAPGVRDQLGEILFRFLLECVVGWGTFIADPHPGNYRFDPGGAGVTFLDFGCVKQLAEPQRLAIRDLLRAALDDDQDATRRAAERLGVLAPGAGLAASAGLDTLSFLYAPYREDAPMPFPPVLSGPALRAAAGGSLAEALRGLRIPGHLPLLNRTVVGLYAVLGRLGARANWHRIAAEHVRGDPPSTPLGEAAQRWREEGGADGALSAAAPARPPAAGPDRA